MKLAIWFSVIGCMAACATDNGGNAPERGSSDYQEGALTSELTAPVIVNVRVTESPERILQAATAASAAACHGTTTCDGTVLPGGFITVACGAPVCGLDGCGKSGPDLLSVHKVQLQERYQAFATPAGTVCLQYQPTISILLQTCCAVDNE